MASSIISRECDICCETYNYQKHRKIICEQSDCLFEACKACVRNYLIGTTSDPNCMKCNKGWSDTFLVKQLNLSFMRRDYKKHRKDLLLQQQISRLSESMVAVERYKEIQKIQKQIEKLISYLNELKSHIYTNYIKNKDVTKEQFAQFREEKLTINNNINDMTNEIEILKNGRSNENNSKKETKNFIMSCPNTDCRGYLSTQYKCELCEFHTCSKCFELIGKTRNDTHECKKENIDSAEYIRKQSKPCPCCGIRISKIDGCDQMWCTQCHKAFSWNTGKIVTGTIHNPHFYQFQRENGAGIVARNPEDIICGGLCRIHELNDELINNFVSPCEIIYNNLIKLHQLINHILHVIIPPIRGIITANEDCLNERVKYIVKEISKEELANRVVHKDIMRKKNVDLLHIYELMIEVGIDMFRNIINIRNTLGINFCVKKYTVFLHEEYQNFEKLCDYANTQFKQISITYGMIVPCISLNKRTIITTKYNLGGGIAKCIIVRDEKWKNKVLFLQELNTKLIEKRKEELKILEETKLCEKK